MKSQILNIMGSGITFAGRVGVSRMWILVWQHVMELVMSTDFSMGWMICWTTA